MKINPNTTGYSGKNVAELKSLIDALDAILNDVRFSPTSRRLEWRREYLQDLLKENYRHIPQLGNRTFRENKITIHHPELGIKIITALNRHVVLMCGCEKPNSPSDFEKTV